VFSPAHVGPKVRGNVMSYACVGVHVEMVKKSEKGSCGGGRGDGRG
jgi:hypothetical protein